MPRRFLRWFALAFLIKGVMFVAFHFAWKTHPEGQKSIGGISFLIRDVGDYYLPTENLVDNGTYGRYSEPLSKWLYATRMPGFVPIYGPPYFLFGRTAAHFFTVLLAFLIDVLSVVALSFTAERLFRSRAVFYVTFFTYAISAYASGLTHMIRSDPFCGAFTIFAVFFFVRAAQEEKKCDWFWSGIFIGWATFLRPATGALIPTFLFVYLLSTWRIRLQFRTFFRNCFIFILPFCIALTFWTYRNFRIFHRFEPMNVLLEDFFAGQPQMEALWKAIPAWGGELNMWGKRSYFHWFYPPEDVAYDQECSESNPFDERIFTPEYNFESLKKVRALYWKSYDKSLPAQERDIYAREVADRVNSYLESYKAYHPFYYAFVANMKMIKQMVFVGQPTVLPYDRMVFWERAIRGFYFFLYYIVLFGWMLGTALALVDHNRLGASLCVLPIAHIFAHAVVIGWINNWYLIPVYPIFVLFMSYAAVNVLQRCRAPS